MFGGSSGSPYSAFGLTTAPNRSAGSGGALSARDGAPLPSGGRPDPNTYSVYNQSLDSETQPVASTLVFPSTRDDYRPDDGDLDSGDLVFVLRECEHLRDLKSREARLGGHETPIVSLCRANGLLRKWAAKENDEWKWVADPAKVAEAVVPFGVCNGRMQMNRWGGGGDPAKRRRLPCGYNVVVGCRASMRNNLFPVGGTSEAGTNWHSHTMQPVWVCYKKCKVSFGEDAQSDAGDKGKECVQIFLLLGHPSVDCAEGGALEIDNSQEGKPTVRDSAIDAFQSCPRGAGDLLVRLGRVLHSAPRRPSSEEVVNSCIYPSRYAALAPIELQLGSH